MPTSAGTLALAGMTTPDDAFQVRKLREAGAVILGKTNMHELHDIDLSCESAAVIGGLTIWPQVQSAAGGRDYLRPPMTWAHDLLPEPPGHKSRIWTGFTAR
jgi:hypothetical protein